MADLKKCFLGKEVTSNIFAGILEISLMENCE